MHREGELRLLGHGEDVRERPPDEAALHVADQVEPAAAELREHELPVGRPGDCGKLAHEELDPPPLLLEALFRGRAGAGHGSGHLGTSGRRNAGSWKPAEVGVVAVPFTAAI